MLHIFNLFPCCGLLCVFSISSISELNWNLSFFVLSKLLLLLMLVTACQFMWKMIQTRVCNDSISSEVKNIPEICICRDGMFTFILLILIISSFHITVSCWLRISYMCFVGKIRLIKYGESIGKIFFDELSKLSCIVLLNILIKNERKMCSSC